eukprot:341141_1
MHFLTETCIRATTCTNCTASGCVWCGDALGCHEAFSPSGCVSGLPCNDTARCMRKKPQPLDSKQYPKVNGLVCIITVSVAVVFITALWIAWRYFAAHRKRKRKIMNSTYMINQSNPPVLYGSNEESVPHPDTILSPRNYHNSIANIEERLRTEYRSYLQTRANKQKDAYVKCLCRLASCASFIIMIVSFITILIFPTAPQYTICNTHAQWTHIWSSLAHDSPQTTYNMLLTVRNNNYFNVYFSDISTRIYYDKVLIGYWYPHQYDMYISSHSMMDILAEVTFIPPISDAIAIYNQYEENNLHLEIHFIGNTKSYFLDKNKKMKLFNTHFNLDKTNFVIGATKSMDMSDCYCH